MTYDLIPCNDPILKTRVEKFDFENPEMDPIEVAKILAETMISNNGLGLSANQIGLPIRAFAMMAEKIIVCFNPYIVDYSNETVLLEEGCLSYPNLFIKIKRPKKIKVRYTEPNGNVVTKVFDGITARIFQHEISHLDGISHINLASRIHKEQAYKKFYKSMKRQLSK